MTTTASGLWIYVLLIGGCGLLAMAHGMAVIARAHMQVHDKRLKVAKLRRRYAAELSGEEDGDHEPVDVEIIETSQGRAATEAPAPQAKAA